MSDAQLWILLALAALLPGPLLHALSRGRGAVPAMLDGFALITVSVLVCFELLPAAMEVVGVGAIVVALLGMMGPVWFEKQARTGMAAGHRVMLGVGLAGLVLHSLTDGMMLVAAEGAGHDHGHGHGHDDHGHGLSAAALAVLTHRLPVGLGLWALVRPRFGTGAALAVLGVDAVATVAGSMLGLQLMTLASSPAYAWFQALVGGSLLHMLLHRHGVQGAVTRQDRRAEALGGLAGALLLWRLPSAADGHAIFPQGWVERLTDLALESAPALLIGYLAAGMLAMGGIRLSRGWVARGGPASQAMRGMAFGLPLPICSCGVVPMYQGMVRQGFPPTAGMAFLIATPELGIESLLLSFPLLGGPLTLARLLAAAAIALLVGIWIGRMVPALAPPAAADALDAVKPWPGRLREGLRFGFGELVDETLVWVLAGLAIAAIFDPHSLSGWTIGWPPGGDVLALALLGLPIYVCASGATPLAAALIAAGVSPGAAIAFLLAGPATNATTFGVLTQLHGRRIALFFGGLVFVLAVVAGLVTNLAVEVVLPTGAGLHHHHDHGPLRWVALGTILALGAATIWRQGVRGFLHPLLHFGQTHVHGDDCGHDPGCGHDHGPGGHVHGPGCGHDHGPGGHVHGPGCGHDHGGGGQGGALLVRGGMQGPSAGLTGAAGDVPRVLGFAPPPVGGPSAPAPDAAAPSSSAAASPSPEDP
jgi:uncharacterized membrane protein YraQ (UPF0718 family)